MGVFRLWTTPYHMVRGIYMWSRIITTVIAIVVSTLVDKLVGGQHGNNEK